MTTEAQDNSAPHHDEAHITLPVAILVQIGDNAPRPLGRDTISVRGTLNPDGTAITFDREETAKATVQAVTRIITKDSTGRLPER